MDLRDDSFWMGGRYASSLVEVTNDLSRLDDGNFWAVAISFEGDITLARFGSNVDLDFPFSQSHWKLLEGHWTSSLSKDQYCQYVERIRGRISDGWVYQVNACRQLKIASDRDELATLFGKLLSENPAPYAAYLSLPQMKIASASPELFLLRNGSTVKTSPIKGTQNLDEQGFGNKDQSENVMIVDLMRNDLGRICKPGSVDVVHLLRSEEHPGLRHLVSDVVGELRSGISWSEIFDALLPAGSISGAPKSSALSVIAENEEVQRGPYCGVLGWVEGDRAELSVAIRIFWQENDGYLKFGTGAGITYGSDPVSEWEETELKAQRLISIAGGTIK
jgi:para-aminobenzoate synthetase component 1